jgi:sulfite reductase beta subunit-like hemoprotein
MGKLISAIAACVLLAGCTSAMSSTERDAAKHAQAVCTSLGVKSGTPQFGECTQRIYGQSLHGGVQ